MRHKEIILFAILMIAANTPLFWGGCFEGLSFIPEKVCQGQLWRIVTHPFVHVSFYHLLLDGAAFLMLYGQLAEKHLAKRLGYLAGTHAGVLAAVTLTLPAMQVVGYCGLSGVAHGLMAVWCLERLLPGPSGEDKTERWLAAGIFTGLLAKSIYETAAGHAFFASMHLGDVGVPVVTSHLGGVIGGIITFGILNASQIGASIKNGRKQYSFSENLS